MNTKIRPNKVFNLASVVPAAVGFLSAVFMGYVFWWPPQPAYQPIQGDVHSVSYQEGYIRIHRVYCINDSTIPITVSRDLVKVVGPGEQSVRYTLPQTVQTYELGCHTIDRVFDIPDYVENGNYKLEFVATWDANPFRRESVKLPVINVAIRK